MSRPWWTRAVVVQEEVTLELASQPGEARVQVAREGRPPALVEDLLMQLLDVRRVEEGTLERELRSLFRRRVAVAADDELCPTE